jgi:hypothetical protein
MQNEKFISIYLKEKRKVINNSCTIHSKNKEQIRKVINNSWKVHSKNKKVINNSRKVHLKGKGK